MMEGGRSVLRRRLARVFRASSLLRSTCNPSATTAGASNGSIASDIAGEPVFVATSRRHLFHDQLERSPFLPSSDEPRGHRRVAVGWGSVDCGSCRSMRALEFGLVKKDKGGNGIAKKIERRVRETGGFYETGEGEGWTCPPASPSSPSTSFYYYDCLNKEGEEKKEKNTEKKNKKKLLSNGYGFSSSSSVDSEDEVGFFSSEERETKEVETETHFSSRSFSSDCFEFYKRPSSNNDRKKKKKKKKNKSSHRPPIRGVRSRNKLHARDGFRPLVSISSEEKKKEWVRVDDEEQRGFAVVKPSTDPYADFRSSMVEMILERQIFGASELELLLHSYLSLNSRHHHPAIIRAFSDVCEVLFAN